MPANLVMSAKARRFMQMPKLAQQFAAAAPNITADAARAATAESRNVFQSRLSGRPAAPPRPGRSTPHGAFAAGIIWSSTGDWINFDASGLQKIAPAHWLIQEIGTGKEAQILNPPGNVRTKSQRDRPISAFLFWAPGPGASVGKGSKNVGQDQLYLAQDVNIAGFATHSRNGGTAHRRGRIRREVKGKHFIKLGGYEGFTVLAEGLIGEAERIFK